MEKQLSEHDLEKWVIKNLSRIEKGLTYVGHQVSLGDFGRLDVLCRDSKGHYVIVELKRPNEVANDRIVSQLYKYRAGLTEKEEYEIEDPTEVRILCLVNKIEPRARTIFKQAGIGIATYDLKEIDFPERTAGTSSERELMHAVFPVKARFYSKLKRYCFYDLDRPVKWIREGSVIVFYTKKRLMGDCKVVSAVRKYKATREVKEFLYKIRYLPNPSSKFYETLIVHDGLHEYPHPVPWDWFLKEFRPSKPSPQRQPWIRAPRQPWIIDENELAWIRHE